MDRYTETDYGAEIVDKYVKFSVDESKAEWKLGHGYFLTVAKPTCGKRYLDVGSGPGNFSQLYSQAGAHIIGIDKSAKAVEAAKRNDSYGDYRHYTGLLAELVGEEIDEIIATFSFCVVPDRELRYMLRDMRKLLRPGCKMTILEPNFEKAMGTHYRDLHYHPQEDLKIGDFVHVTLGNGDDAVELYDDIYRTQGHYHRQLLQEAGFTNATMFEPIPGEDWGSEWDLERQIPPYFIIEAE